MGPPTIEGHCKNRYDYAVIYQPLSLATGEQPGFGAGLSTSHIYRSEPKLRQQVFWSFATVQGGFDPSNFNFGYRGGVDNDNWFFPVFVEPQAFLRQKYEDATIAFALEERLACFGRQPRSGDGHRELERQQQFSPDTMITMK